MGTDTKTVYDLFSVTRSEMTSRLLGEVAKIIKLFMVADVLFMFHRVISFQLQMNYDSRTCKLKYRIAYLLRI